MKKTSTNEGSYFYFFPFNQLCFISQNIYILFILSFIIFIKWYHLYLFHPPDTQPKGQQLAFPHAFDLRKMATTTSLNKGFWNHTPHGTVHSS